MGSQTIEAPKQAVDTPKTTVQTGLYSMLTEYFGIKPEIAAAVSEKTTEEEFSVNFGRLEEIVGKGNAEKIMKEGSEKKDSVIHYRNGYMEYYLNLASQAADKIIKEAGWDINTIEEERKDMLIVMLIEDNIKHFYTVGSLEKFLKPLAGNSHSKVSDLDIPKYMLLHSDNDNSVRYLDSLISEGYVRVGRHEHRSRNKDGGLRGTNILKNIQHQLKSIFSDLGLAEPTILFSDDAKRMDIDQESRKYLPNIKDVAYSRQKK